MWLGTIKTSQLLICPPAPTAFDIGQFLDVSIRESERDIQHWVETYAGTLQHIGEAVDEWCWTAQVKRLCTEGLIVGGGFVGVLRVKILLQNVGYCWESLPENVLHQQEECPLSHVISYLDEQATHHPMHKAWDIHSPYAQAE